MGGILALTAAAGEQLQLCQLAHVPSGHLVCLLPQVSRNVAMCYFVFRLTKITVGLGPGTPSWGWPEIKFFCRISHLEIKLSDPG